MSESLVAKKVIVEIIRLAGRSLTGTTRLYKAFYFAHLYFAEYSPGYLSDWPIVKMPNGPGIDEGDSLLDQLVATKVIQTSSKSVGPYKAIVYKLTGVELPGEKLSSDATDAIKKAVDFVKAKSATQLSDITHEFSRSWKKVDNGREMNIYIDVIPEDEFSKRRRELKSLRNKIAEAAGN